MQNEKFLTTKYSRITVHVHVYIHVYLAGNRQKVPAITSRQNDDVMDQSPGHALTEALGEGGEGGVRIQRLEKVVLILLLLFFLFVLVLLTGGRGGGGEGKLEFLSSRGSCTLLLPQEAVVSQQLLTKRLVLL